MSETKRFTSGIFLWTSETNIAQLLSTITKEKEREKGDDMWTPPPHVIHVSETAIQNQ